ncbi:helix-turn-helix domain-containing protein [Streptomyces sp. ID05-39B]|uniref:helix-turn-helix domain-containing protein n=1 Tax=Streptomyces sp. ID05-39B TaxID=3028664 RepID=UPI0029B2ECA6|nr:helix-turn-helix domain-containing protein [Streptomyces sp. ID05-39B]MDX3526512.1 helix-turn-helix domain-containing protein [Streptomyces sp. ID05-39B]
MTTPSGSPVDALQRFGGLLRQLRKEAGLTVRGLADVLGVSGSTISKTENGRHAMPPDFYMVKSWVTKCQDHARTRSRSLSVSVDVDWWRTQHGQLEHLSSQRWEAARAGQDWPARIPVSQWDPLRLGVRRAITVTSADAGRPFSSARGVFRVPPSGELPLLPPYAERDHDRRLRAFLARTFANTCVVAIGDSSSGKTRTMWEAVLRCRADWALIRPDSAADLARLAVARIGPNTVVWLDEFHSYLLDADAGAAAARALGMLMEAPGPCLIIGSMWPRHWDELTRRPEQGADHHRLAREFLENHVEEIGVPDSFAQDSAAQELLRHHAAHDPRLAIAHETAGERWRVTQTLSGGRQLVSRYERGGDRHGTAIMSVAMDARRLGIHGPYTAAFLRAAVDDYLPVGSERVGREDWFERALASTSEEVHGIAALTPVRNASGVGEADGFVLHEYLAQHGERTRQHLRIPASLWDALSSGADAGFAPGSIDATAHVDAPETLHRLGTIARIRMLYGYAEQFLWRAAQAGATAAYLDLADLLTDQERHDESDQVLQLAIPTQPYAHVYRARRFSKQGRVDDAMASYIAGAEACDDTLGRGTGVHPRLEMAEMLSRHDRVEEAIAVWQEASDAGLPVDRTQFADLLAKQGRLSTAVAELRKDINRGSGLARSSLVHFLARHGMIDEALTELRAADPEDLNCGITHVARLLIRQGNKDEAFMELRDAADRGDLIARRELGRILEQDGQTAEALREHRLAGARDDLIRLLKARGEDEAVRAELQAAIESLQEAADAGDTRARVQRGFLYAQMGDLSQAFMELRIAADNGHELARFALAQLLESHGQAEDAINEVVTAGQVGALDIREELIRMLNKQGKNDLARLISRYGLLPDGTPPDQPGP